MKSTVLKYNILLLFGAVIWGFAFVAQRVGMDHVGPFLFNAARFALGALTLLPLIMIRRGSKSIHESRNQHSGFDLYLLVGGILAGLTVFAAVSFQQFGLIYTTAGKAGFITGLYVIIVPILGIFWRHNIDSKTWIGALMAVIGLYFLSIIDDYGMTRGDLLVLVSAFLWAVQIQIIGKYAPHVDPIKFAFVQFASCSILSLASALIFEPIELESIYQAGIPILYAGVMSSGVAFTIQIVAQKHSPAAHAAIIMSLESVFAVLGGWLLLSEVLTYQGALGCVLMFSGMILSQSEIKKRGF